MFYWSFFGYRFTSETALDLQKHISCQHELCTNIRQISDKIWSCELSVSKPLVGFGKLLRANGIISKAFEAFAAGHEAVHKTPISSKYISIPVPSKIVSIPLTNIYKDICDGLLNIASRPLRTDCNEILLGFFKNQSKFICFIEQIRNYQYFLRQRSKFEAQIMTKAGFKNQKQKICVQKGLFILFTYKTILVLCSKCK